MPLIARKSRWKFSFRPSSSSSTTDSLSIGNGNDANPAPPMSFICPISSSLMYDPVIVPTGHTFERACIQACIELNFIPPSLLVSSSSSSSSFSFSNNTCSSSSSSSYYSSSFILIPNSALKSAIIDWCDRLALPHPSPISHESARALVQNLIFTNPNPVSVSQKEIQQGDKDCSTTTKTLTNSKPCSSCYSYSSSSTSSFSSSSENIINLTTATSSSSSDDTKSPKKSTTNNNSMVEVQYPPDPCLQDSILMKLKSPHTCVKESGLIALRHSARDGGTHCRMSLCTPTILAALIPMILPNSNNSTTLQVNATAALVNLSIDPPANKVKIVRSGAVPALVEALKHSSSSGSGSDEARYNAAGALFSLALEDENKLAIGVLGAIPPLVNMFCEEESAVGHVGRGEAGMALYHLSLASINLSKIAKTQGAVKAILNIATTSTQGEDNVEEEGDKEMIKSSNRGQRLRLQRVAMMVLASLARKKEGRVALMDANAVKAMVGMMVEEEQQQQQQQQQQQSAGSNNNGIKEEEYCLGVLYEMSKASLRFRALAKAAGAQRVLLQLVSPAAHPEAERRGELAKEMARRILKVIRGDREEDIRMAAAAAMMTLKDNKNEEFEEDEGNDEEEIGSFVSDGLVSFRRRRRFDCFDADGGANSANF